MLENSADVRAPDIEVALPDGVDLHARPAGNVARTAMRFKSHIMLVDGACEANAKSVLSVMALGLRGGSVVRLRADGADAVAALEAVRACIVRLE